MKKTSTEQITLPLYSEYTMTLADRITGFAVGAVIGVIVAQIFFGFIAVDVIVAVIAGIAAVPVYRRMIIKRRLKLLLVQFRDMLDILGAAYSSGMITTTAFSDAEHNLIIQYGEKSMICQEIRRVNYNAEVGDSIEEALLEFAERSGLDDIKSFASVMYISKESGGNIRQIVNETRGIIGDKIEIEQEIQTIISGAESSLNIMICLPLLVVPMAQSFVSEGSNGAIVLGVKIFGIILFAGAYALGRKMTNIKV